MLHFKFKIRHSLQKIRRNGAGKLPPTIIADAKPVRKGLPRASLSGLLASLGQPFDELPDGYPLLSRWDGVPVRKHTCGVCGHQYLEMNGVGIHTADELCDHCVTQYP